MPDKTDITENVRVNLVKGKGEKGEWTALEIEFASGYSTGFQFLNRDKAYIVEQELSKK